MAKLVVWGFLTSVGLDSLYDFVYVPPKFGHGHCVGHAIVNFVGADVAQEIVETFNGSPGALFDPVCVVWWSAAGHLRQPPGGFGCTLQRRRPRSTVTARRTH